MKNRSKLILSLVIALGMIAFVAAMISLGIHFSKHGSTLGVILVLVVPLGVAMVATLTIVFRILLGFND